jgi:lipopolysaccharide export system protein LptC
MRNEKSDQDRRRRRRRRRIQVIILYTAIAVGLAWLFESQAKTPIIYVTHAEKEESSYAMLKKRRAPRTIPV